jgi:tetratricopeptide (TPR) repeat protein
VLLTGRGPYGRLSNRVDEMVQAVLTMEPSRASQAPGLPPRDVRQLQGDLDNVLAKAVARDPNRRYASVEQFAGDLDAFRRGFPVRARPDTVTYRLRRAIGRHRTAVALGAILGAGLVATTAISVWQVRIAERRLADLRALAHSVVFDVSDGLATIPGTTATRKGVVQTALQYLDRLNQDDVSDQSLRAELAAAYLRIGKVQGGAFVPNLGDAAGAIASFGKAIDVTGDGGTPALDRLRIEGLINMAQLSVGPTLGAPEFEAAARAAERLLATDGENVDSLRLLADACHGLATVAHLTNDVPRHHAMAARQLEVRARIHALVGSAWPDEASRARAMAQLALALHQAGDDRGALAQLDRAEDTLAAALARADTNQLLQRGLAEIRSRKAPVLIALGRPADAAREAQAAAGLLEPLVASDPQNVQYRADLAYAWLRLGDARRTEGRIDEALALHRRALAVRRERTERHSGFIFVPWELVRSLNAVGELLLAVTPPLPDDAAALFSEARDVGHRTLAQSPNYTQVRKQVAIAEEGLARAALARSRAPGIGTRQGRATAEAVMLLKQSATSWREVASRSVGDATVARELVRIAGLLAAVDAGATERKDER